MTASAEEQTLARHINCVFAVVICMIVLLLLKIFVGCAQIIYLSVSSSKPKARAPTSVVVVKDSKKSKKYPKSSKNKRKKKPSSVGKSSKSKRRLIKSTHSSGRNSKVSTGSSSDFSKRIAKKNSGRNASARRNNFQQKKESFKQMDF